MMRKGKERKKKWVGSEIKEKLIYDNNIP